MKKIKDIETERNKRFLIESQQLDQVQAAQEARAGTLPQVPWHIYLAKARRERRGGHKETADHLKHQTSPEPVPDIDA